MPNSVVPKSFFDESEDFFGPFQLHNKMSRILNDFEQQMGLARSTSATQQQGNGIVSTRGAFDWLPSLDIHDADKEVTVHADLPGLKKEQVKIDLHGNKLVISGENNQESSFDDKGWKVRERSYGKFERSVLLPKSIDPENVQAKLNDGVLEVKVGKLANTVPNKKSITIK
jgi:HSP20 family protein